MGFSRQEHWRGLPCPSPEDLPDPGIEPRSLMLQADSLLLSHLGRSVDQGILLNVDLDSVVLENLRF